jgi:hypothetical protein
VQSPIRELANIEEVREEARDSRGQCERDRGAGTLYDGAKVRQ